MSVNDLFGPAGKDCSKCRAVKPVLDFHRIGKLATNRPKYSSRCKSCYRDYSREYYERDPTKYRDVRKRYANRTRDVSIQRSRDFYYSHDGRAKILLKAAQHRSKQKGWETDLTTEFIERLLATGKCSVTGIPFDYSKPKGTVKNPYAPSLDRINSSKPYVCDNVRVVIWQYNLMKGELSDEEVREICKKVLNV